LSASLQKRFFYDPIGTRLGIKGFLNDKDIGDPTLTADPPARVADVACGVGWAGIATEASFDSIEILHQQIAKRGARGENRIRGEHLLLLDDVHLRVSFLLRFD